MSKPKLYVGCSLTQAPTEFVAQVVDLKKELAKEFEIMEFFGLKIETQDDSQKVYEHDRNCVLNSDLFLAICDYPSIGLGMEIGFAIENQKNMVIAYNSKSKITRMLLGIPKTQNIQFCQYENIAEVSEFLKVESELVSIN